LKQVAEDVSVSMRRLFVTTPECEVISRTSVVGEVAQPENELRYQFKAEPYSSHSLLMSEFPLNGKGLRVLDIGCWHGYIAALLADRGYSVTGVDFPGTPHHDRMCFVAADLNVGLPQLFESFDFILCADVLEHVRDPQQLLRECQGLLTPGGRLIASLPNSGNIYFRLNVLFGRFPQDDRGLFDRTHVHFYTWDGWRNLFTAGGFQLTAVRCSGMPFGLATPRWANSLPVRALERASFELAKAWKTLFAYQFIVNSERKS
jgi:SAM-dependent methyltransferase